LKNLCLNPGSVLKIEYIKGASRANTSEVPSDRIVALLFMFVCFFL